MRKLPALITVPQLTSWINNPAWERVEVLTRLQRCGAVFKTEHYSGWLTSPSILLSRCPELYNELRSEESHQSGLPLLMTVGHLAKRIANTQWKYHTVRYRLRRCGALFKMARPDGSTHTHDEWLTTPGKLQECFVQLYTELNRPGIGDFDDLDVV
jgi:hypothetical protein